MTKSKFGIAMPKAEHPSFEIRIPSFVSSSSFLSATHRSMPSSRSPGFSAGRRLCRAETQSPTSSTLRWSFPTARRRPPAFIRRTWCSPRRSALDRSRTPSGSDSRRLSSTRAMPTPAPASGAIAMRPAWPSWPPRPAGRAGSRRWSCRPASSAIPADGKNRRRHSGGRSLLGQRRRRPDRRRPGHADHRHHAQAGRPLAYARPAARCRSPAWPRGPP